LIDWFHQDAVRRERLIVVGAGAVGNEVIKNLALLGVGEIHVFDRDSIEIHNLTRSVLFRESDVGQPKAVCAAARARELDPSVAVTPYVGDFWSTLRLSDIRAATAVFSCVDNFEARIRLNRLCALTGTPLINVGIDSRFAVVEHFPFNRACRVPCYECSLPQSAYAAISKRYSCGWLKRVAVAERKIPTTIITSSAAASLAVSIHLRSLAEGLDTAAWRHFQDTFTGRTTRTEICANDECPGCADLLDNRVLVAARRRIGPPWLDAPADVRPGPLMLSDPVLTHVRCRQCGVDDTASVLLQPADRYDERLAVCPHCHEPAREIRVREQFDVEELLRDYDGYDLPGKFIVTRLDEALQLVVELEGDEHVRGEGDSENSRPHAEGGGDGTAGSEGR
jgi:molybdopterin/thiamine biosynthesis adenylyltransferase